MSPVTVNNDGTVTISLKEYEDLLADQQWLMCLQGAGVDNWQGYDDALELRNSDDWIQKV